MQVTTFISQRHHNQVVRLLLPMKVSLQCYMLVSRVTSVIDSIMAGLEDVHNDIHDIPNAADTNTGDTIKSADNTDACHGSLQSRVFQIT
jgi:hypothetical protein